MTERSALLEALVVALRVWLADPSNVTFQPLLRILKELEK